MAFLLLGVLFLGLKLAEVSPVADWAWWIILAPFGLAAAWWSFADSSGITAQKQSDMVDEKAQKRREKNLEAIGVSREAIASQRKAFKSRKAATARGNRAA